ncbi:MAG: hypothetical protein M3Q20_04170, partial [Actinomycetota bacterium]|nr:hypothetical protein [Actinomycetota bacterium]
MAPDGSAGGPDGVRSSSAAGSAQCNRGLTPTISVGSLERVGSGKPEPFVCLGARARPDPWSSPIHGRTMSNTPKRLARLLARLAVAVALVVPSVVVAAGSASVAAPTQAEVEAAQAEAEAIGHDLEVAIERYNDARVRLDGVQDKLAAALDDKETAEAVAAKATGQLEDRAVQAYTGAGSQIDVLLGASDLAEFSDRLEFMGALAQNDADLANTAENAQQQAEWAAARYADTIGDKQAELDQMESARAEIERML